MDRFIHFSDLEKQFTEGIHFRKTKIDRGCEIVILAPHGGCIERGTSELARAVAGENLSLYLFEGLMRIAKDSQALHITSTRFDEPRCLNLIRRYPKALAIHGCCGKEPMIFVGGKDNTLKNALIIELSAKGYPIQLGTGKYAGSCSANICNRTSTCQGVQLELSNGLRRLLFDDWKNRKGRKITTDLFARMASDIRDVIE